jgi:hypothetical protein
VRCSLPCFGTAIVRNSGTPRRFERTTEKVDGCYAALEDWYKRELSKQNDHKVQRIPEPPSGFVSLLGKITVQISYDLENSTAYDYTLQGPNS